MPNALMPFALTWLIGIALSIHAAEAPKTIAVGEWSNPVVDKQGRALRGRLMLCEKQTDKPTREVAVYIELQEASDSVGGSLQVYCELGKTDFRPEYHGGLSCDLVDKDKRPVKTTPFPFGGGVPASQWVTLPSDATIRLRTSPFGIRRDGALAICPALNQLWVIPNDDLNEYFLSGKFIVAPSADKKPPTDDHVWRGEIDFPPMRIANTRR